MKRQSVEVLPWAAVAACTAMIALVASAFWPGIPAYDTLYQYREIVRGSLTDWHPPIMAVAWRELLRFGSGTAPIFLVQVALYAGGFGLLIWSLCRAKRGGAAAAVAALALSPLLLGWQMVVMKDEQLLGALMGAFGLVAVFRAQSVRMPVIIVAAVILLLLYATMLRANAMFATAPLSVALLPRPASSRLRSVFAATAILLAPPTAVFVNHLLFGASISDRMKTQPIYDLAAIAVRVDDDRTGFDAHARAALKANQCVNPFFWDPLQITPACVAIIAPVRKQPTGDLYLRAATMALDHSVAYLAHRLQNWNMTERLWTPRQLLDGAPPSGGQPNDLGLAFKLSPSARLWQAAAAAEAETPLGWPIVWSCTAMLLLPAAYRRRDTPDGSLATALLVSALTLEGSFFIVGVAAELRYHLWPMAATCLAVCLLASYRRAAVSSLTATILLLVILIGTTARVFLPPAPATYEATLSATL